MYAVVRFSEDQESVSEVPRSWLSHDNNTCWWPRNAKNVSLLISKAISPNPDTWDQHGVAVEFNGLSLETARKKAQDVEYSSSDEKNRGRGKRVKIPNITNESSSDDCGYTQKNAWRRTTNVMISPPSLSKDLEITKDVPNVSTKTQYVDIASLPVVLEEGGHSESTSIYEEHQFENYIPPAAATVSCTNVDDIVEINANIKKLCRMVTSMSLTLSNINSRMENLEKTNPREKEDDIRHEFIDQFLPLDTVQHILEFEQQLTDNNDAQSLFGKFVTHIGGNSPKDNTNRILKRIFTNGCAMSCSWMGHRNNFRISTLVIIRFVKEAVCSSFTSLKENEFETIASEWFRFAKQRFLREQKETK